MRVAMMTTLVLEQHAPAAGDEIGFSKQLLLQRAKARRCILESGELVHAIIDDHVRIDRPAEGERSRRVIPEHRRRLAEIAEQGFEKALHGKVSREFVVAGRQMW